MKAPLRPIRSGDVLGAWRSLLPAGVADAVLTETMRELGPVALRRRHHARGRHCARLALRRLGVAANAVPSAPSGRPTWPADVVGSITHCDGFVAAIVARRSALRGVGCDAEVRRRLQGRDLPRIATRDEPAAHRGICAAADLPTLLLSAKESVFKALPEVGAARFDRFALRFCPRRRSFWVAEAEPPALARLAPRIVGRYAILRHHVLCVAGWR